MPRGEANRRTTEEDRAEMLEMRQRGVPVKDIAARYGISPTTVSQHTADKLREEQNSRSLQTLLRCAEHKLEQAESLAHDKQDPALMDEISKVRFNILEIIMYLE